MALALGTGAFGAGAMAQDVGLMLRQCSNPDTSPAEALRICDLALDYGADELDREAQARVAFNAGVAALDLDLLGRAAERLDRAVALDPDMAAARVSRAQVRERRGDVDGALADYEAAIEADPQAAAPRLAQGRLLLATGEAEAALESLDVAVARAPDWAANYRARGAAHYALGRYAEAERDFSTVIARAPGDAEAWLNRAQARAATGSATAGRDFDRAVALAPEWATAHYVRGLWLEAAGRSEEAGAAFLRAHELGYRSADLEEIVRGLSGGG
ncbi:MAG: tetratricopeptide repeat protein [Paracoccaceae bacterium]